MQIERGKRRSIDGILEFPIEHFNYGYGYAYANKDGKGFSDTEPYVNVDYVTYDDAKKAAIQSASTFGLKNMILFKYDEDLPQSITWDYVKEHSVDGIMYALAIHGRMYYFCGYIPSDKYEAVNKILDDLSFDRDCIDYNYFVSQFINKVFIDLGIVLTHKYIENVFRKY